MALSTNAGPWGDALPSIRRGRVVSMPSRAKARRSTTCNFSALVTPAGALQHFCTCNLNAVSSFAERFAAASDGLSKPIDCASTRAAEGEYCTGSVICGPTTSSPTCGAFEDPWDLLSSRWVCCGLVGAEAVLKLGLSCGPLS